MSRVHAPELEDYPWFPPVLRDALTGFLGVASRVLRLERAVGPIVREAFAHTGVHRIVDLCSGAGGPALALAQHLTRELGEPVELVLTDKYPNLAAFARAQANSPSKVIARNESIDACDVPEDLVGVRTLFNALHHLPEDVARGVLDDAARKRQPLVSVELVERSVQGAAIVLGLPAVVLALMPFVSPRSVTSLALTYGVPLVPAMVTWDGFASCLRAYSQPELEQLVLGLDRPGYRFRVLRRRIPGRVFHVTCLVGMPH